MSALELVQRITRFRPELDVYILIAQEQEDDVVDALFAEAVDGYFYREERDYRGIYRILNAQIQERARTPFYDQLKNYVWMAKDQWHTPGPLLGRIAARQPVGQRLLRVHGRARVRRRPVGVGADARLADGAEGGDRAKRRRWRPRRSARGAPSSPPNGTSTANKVIFQTLIAPGEKLILDRNCHKSVHHGVVLSGAHPIYVDAALNQQVRPLWAGAEEGAAECHKKASRRAGADHHLVHLRRPALRPAADRRGGARRGHQGDHRRGLVRLRALPSRVPAHGARGRRRLRHPVDAQGALGVLAGAR